MLNTPMLKAVTLLSGILIRDIGFEEMVPAR